MKDFFQKMLKNKLIMAIVSIIVGIILIVFQNSSVEGVLRIIGAFLMAGGIICLITYFFGKENRKNPSTLASAVLYLLSGLLCLFAPEWLVAFFPVVMGIVLIINSVYNLSALFSVQTKNGTFWLGIILSIINLILGVIAVIHPDAMASVLIIFIGITYVFNGVCDLAAISIIGKKSEKDE